ncbi:MBL fold metallo-hydrolase [Candidatus Woesearchaeota archaeon]|nr:MBL fold metallo-hydrolase [Candidatus Woesearchaeota archaeon]
MKNIRGETKAKMTTLTFYGGANEIGGNKILLEDKGVKLFFDFGESFSFFKDYTIEYLQPREGKYGMLDYFEFKTLPEIGGIYSERMLECSKLKYQAPKVDGVFISHCHMDHVNHIRFLDPKIPIHLGHGTKAIMDINEEISPAFSNYGKEGHNYKVFKTGDKIKIKHLVIEPVHIDHSMPAAYGFIIHTSSGPVIYTGDIRMHGPEKRMTEEFIRKAKKANPVAMLCEGTRMAYDSKENHTEEDVYKKANKIIGEAKNLVLTDFSRTNVDRFKTFYKATVDNGRKLVIDSKAAHLYYTLKDKMGLPDVMTDKNILVYYRAMRSCAYSEKDYDQWERPYMKKMIGSDYVRKNQDELVIMFNLYRMFELVSIKPKTGSDYIYSQSEHFLEGPENEEATEIRENWLKHFKFREVKHSSEKTDHMHHLHSSGHAPKEDITRIIKTIKTETLIPMHTQWPEEFKKTHKNVITPEIGKEIKI